MRIKFFFLFFFNSFIFLNSLNSQIVFENINTGVYEFLDRMSHKGYINYHDIIKPINRTYINQLLNELQSFDTVLLEIEKKEIKFYLKEYSLGNMYEKDNIKKLVFNKISAPIYFSAKNTDNYINILPILNYSQNKHNNSNFYQFANGLNVWGRIGKSIGFNLSYKDIFENRSELVNDSLINNALPGFVLLTKELDKTKKINFTEYRATIAYEWKNGFISFGQDNFTWGYGINGKIVISEKSPLNQYLRLHYKPFTWLKFDFAHHWLNSNFIDSANTYNYGNTIYGGNRINYLPKFLSTHTLTLTPIKGMNLSFGESIIYNEKPDIGFLNPLQFYKIYDNNKSLYEILNGNNGQIFMQLSLRNIIPKANIYSSVFVDEIKLFKIFNKNESRNQLGYNLGIQMNDIFIPYLAFFGEYTRVNPFVYTNLNPAQNYTSFGFNLGDWVGNNFDRKIIGLKYTPIPRFRLELRYQNIRKGPEYSIEEQYLSTPTRYFLEYVTNKQSQFALSLNYELINNIYVLGNYNYTKSQNISAKSDYINNNYNLGFKIGL
jgi:hypothetical protein